MARLIHTENTTTPSRASTCLQGFCWTIRTAACCGIPCSMYTLIPMMEQQLRSRRWTLKIPWRGWSSMGDGVTTSRLMSLRSSVRPRMWLVLMVLGSRAWIDSWCVLPSRALCFRSGLSPWMRLKVGVGALEVGCGYCNSDKI